MWLHELGPMITFRCLLLEMFLGCLCFSLCVVPQALQRVQALQRLQRLHAPRSSEMLREAQRVSERSQRVSESLRESQKVPESLT